MTDPIASPCIRICRIDPTLRLCTGCLRSLDEIAAWSSMTPEARARVLNDLPARRSLSPTAD